ncbi:uncharacterized protein LOC104904039 isoform X1 [Beta vulgaris subsp. vulgaris]|uniref:uncharacterized protein LOC104904039 isoform X1 n=1 Tax=Beta vulgaris subsp. vulgaris TaxID=3555 RepID=UPI0020368B69|nr:uncharacterized protein LOC104904039 isoform X1 [Beta vulgaris subsp. vulgaris]XP_019107519.2 uncharacterized protein LOC104904039 isoform X1 [Beta vulgaris subsp. vulgaris]
MSYRSKRTRIVAASKIKDAKVQSVEDVVSQVVHDVATAEAQDEEEQDEEMLRSSCCNQSTDRAATDQPNQGAYTEVGDTRSNLGKTSGRETFAPSPSQPFPTKPSPRFKAARRRSLRVQDTGFEPNHSAASRGPQAQEAQLSSSCNIWLDDPPMTEPGQATTREVNDVRSNKRSVAERQFHTPPPSQPLRAGSPSQLKASRSQSFWVDEDVEEPSQRGLSQGRRAKPANWSDDIEFDEMEEVEMRDLDGRRGKKGGRILPRHVWSLRPGVRFVVPVNELDQPVRRGGHVLVKFLGDVAKNGELCPIGEVNWHKVDKSCKANIINLIRDKFVLPNREEIDKSILKHVGKKWRAHRYELKVQYKKPDSTQEKVASTVPRGVDPSQWIRLVQYWFSERSQFLSAKGKEARALQSHLHTTGAKSFARMRDEFVKTHGREPGALEWFAQTHLRKDGTYVEDSSKEFLDAAAAMVAQRGSTSSPTKRIAIENQVFNELMYSDDERCYRPIGYGFGANRNKLFGVGEELRKRGYSASGTSTEAGNSTRNKLLGIGPERKRSSYSALDTSTEVDRLNFAMATMGETNELMQAQIQMQAQQLKMQSQQLQMQSKQMEGLQFQLQQVTSLLNKFGVMLNNPKNDPTRRGNSCQGINVNNAQPQVPEASSEYTDSGSDSIEWDSDQ